MEFFFQDLFQSMVNLSQLSDQDCILQAYLDAVNRLNPDLSIWKKNGFLPSDNYRLIPISTNQRNFGEICVSGNFDHLPEEKYTYLQKSVDLLAVILENCDQKAMLQEHDQRLKSQNDRRVQSESEARKASEEKLRINQDRFRILYNLSQKNFSTEKELIDYALEEAVRMTGSKIGYFHFVENGQANLQLMSWSANVLDQCKIPSGQAYPLDTAGIWADCARTHQPTIHNDYPNHPRKHGLPDGHIPIRRHMGVPIIDHGIVVVIAGVGNKPEPYNEQEVMQLQLLMDGVWRILIRKRAEDALKESEKSYRTLVETSPNAIMMLNMDGIILMANEKCARMLDQTASDQIVGKKILDFTSFEYQPQVKQIFEKFIQLGNGTQELVLPRLNGMDFCAEITGQLVKDKTNQPAYLIAILRDISERKQRERELNALEALNNALRFVQTTSEITPSVMELLQTEVRANGAALALYADSTKAYEFILGTGSLEPMRRMRLPIENELVQRMINLQSPLIQNGGELAQNVDGLAILKDMGSSILVPLSVQGGRVGMMVLARNSGDRSFLPSDQQLLSILAEIIANVLHRAMLHEQTENRLQHIQALRTIDMTISSSVDLSVILRVLLDQTTSKLGVDAADILLLDSHAQVLDFALGTGFRTNALRYTHLQLGESLAGTAALERRVVTINNVAEEKPKLLQSQHLAAEGFVTYCCAPLIVKGQVNGVLEIFHRSHLTMRGEWIEFFEALAAQAAIAIDNANLYSDLQRSNLDLTMAYDATIEGWSHALDLRDKETEGHSLRVTENSLRLARMVGISHQDLVHIRRGSLLHDIGKLGVPDAILHKPIALTPNEWEVMKLHPVYAMQLMSPIDYLQNALDIPYCHHEKWDGSGYPRKLIGKQIPLAARVFSIIDVWDALTSDRPYRKAWSEERALEYVRGQSGAHFDPKIVEAFLDAVSGKQIILTEHKAL